MPALTVATLEFGRPVANQPSRGGLWVCHEAAELPLHRFDATLTRQRLQRGVFHSLVDLQAAINRYLGEHNRKPKPFV
jgi:hypothetical protein